MHLETYVYVSEPLEEFGSEDLRVLGERSARFNAEAGVTGYLYFERTRFVQYIEGPGAGLRQVVDRVGADPRHRLLHWLTKSELQERRFPRWSMRLLDREDLAGIRLEHLLTEKLLLSSEQPRLRELWDREIWRLVEALARSAPALQQG